MLWKQSVRRSRMIVDGVPKKKSSSLRLVTFNVNGVRTLFHYHPWNRMHGLAEAFKSLDADVVTLQEIKLGSRDITGSVGRLNGYYSFLSVPAAKKGYSGVGVYVRMPCEDEPASVRAALRVVRAEEGLTGVLHGAGENNTADGEIGGYPRTLSLETSRAIDGEGRCVVVELGNGIVIISVYCPANSGGTEEGEQFRVQFLEALFERVRNLQELGKEVVVMGDINVARDLIDSADGIAELQKLGVLQTPPDNASFEEQNRGRVLAFIRSSMPRMLLNEILIDTLDPDEKHPEKSVLIDCTRKIQGRKKGLYTVWNTIRNSRPGNFGSRIDLILATRSTAARCVDANIWPFLMGSDHCPVYADFDTQGLSTDTTTLPIPRFEARYFYNLSQGGIDSMLSAHSKRGTTTQPKTELKRRNLGPANAKPNQKKPVNTPSHTRDISSFFTQFKQLPTKEQRPSIPTCKHNEECLLKTSNTSDNKGRKFWVCAKPYGHVDTSTDNDKFNCGFFKWK